MSDTTSNQSTFESQYPELHIPEGGWKSNIPEHLLENASKSDIWLMEEMSKNSQATDFACRGAVDLSRHLRTLNGKTYKTEKATSDLADDVKLLKAQMELVNPMAKTFSTAVTVATNKVFLVIFAGFMLFLLGYNRTIIPAIVKYFYGE